MTEYKGFKLIPHRRSVRICDTSEELIQVARTMKKAKQTVDFWLKHKVWNV